MLVDDPHSFCACLFCAVIFSSESPSARLLLLFLLVIRPTSLISRAFPFSFSFYGYCMNLFLPLHFHLPTYSLFFSGLPSFTTYFSRLTPRCISSLQASPFLTASFPLLPAFIAPHHPPTHPHLDHNHTHPQ